MNSFEKSQQNFIRNLSVLINGEYLTKKNLLLSTVLPLSVRTRISKGIIQQYNRLHRDSCSHKDFQCFEIEIKPYTGKNPHVMHMIHYLSEYLADDILGAYLCGSLGTYDEIDYSDFDALVILKGEAFDTSERLARVAKRLYVARSIMFDFDPLQHHGWFTLTEQELRNYPDYYLPYELLKHAKSLFPSGSQNLVIQAHSSSELMGESFYKIAQSLLNIQRTKRYPSNIYQLKGLLSQFMLLPALYLQAKNGKGIYKKFSFEEAKSDFSKEEWSIMEEVSSLRESWTYRVFPLARCLFTKPWMISRFFAKKCAPPIPKKARQAMDDNFYKRLGNLVFSMQEKLKHVG